MDNPAAPIPSVSPHPTVSLPVETPNRRWFLWSAIGLTFLILGIALGVFGAKFFGQSPNLSQLPPTPTPTQSPSPSPTPTPDPTAGWKTFKDDKNKVKFEYPSNWYYQQWPESTFNVFLEDKPFEIPRGTEFISSIQVHFNEVQDTVTNQKYFMEKTISEAQKRITDLFDAQSIRVIENLAIGGKQAIQISGITGPGPLQGDYFKYTLVQLDGKVLFVVLHGKNYESVYNQILSTFKFLK